MAKKTMKMGRPARHGGYSLMVKRGELPERRSYLRAYLSEVRAGLVRDLGPTEGDLTAAQLVLVDRIVSKLSVLRMIEEFCKETGVFDKRGELVGPLGKNYLGWSNSVRLDLQALGISARAGEGVLDLGRYLEHKAKSESSGPGAPGIVQPGASQRESGGKGEAPDNADQLEEDGGGDREEA